MGRHSKPDLPSDGDSTPYVHSPRASQAQDRMTSTGSHRAVGRDASRRGIAKWPIAVLAVIAVLGLGTLAVVWGNNSLNNRADAEGNRCSEGKRTLRVAVAPKLEEPVSTISDKWNAAGKAVHSHCITVEINAAEFDDALESLSRSDTTHAVPAVWIAESPKAEEKLSEAKPGRVATVAEHLRTKSGYLHPYLVIGGDGVDDVQQRAAQQFRGYLGEPGPKEILSKAGFIS